MVFDDVGVTFPDSSRPRNGRNVQASRTGSVEPVSTNEINQVGHSRMRSNRPDLVQVTVSMGS